MTTSTPTAHVATRGDVRARLLAGPGSGVESLADHLLRLGEISPRALGSVRIRELVHDSGLTGRGGGGFPLYRKLDVARSAAGSAIVVVNASEGEPASRKDHALVTSRPHVILDGAALIAEASGASEIYLHVHDDYDMVDALTRAIGERRDAPVGPEPRIVIAPRRYVGGEANAVASTIEGGKGLPRRLPIPIAARGSFGRPTLVSNVETFAHVALIARNSAEWFRAVGSDPAPGSTLVTLAGEVYHPGEVLEIVGPATFSDVLTGRAPAHTPRALLLGGYAGAWVRGDAALLAPVDRGKLTGAGISLGCGLIGVLSDETCGVAETARLLLYLAGESAGQCGPCILGLPELAMAFVDLANGHSSRRNVRRLYDMAEQLRGRGACAHPDGAVRLATSALAVFADEVDDHTRHGRCRSRTCTPRAGFPIPTYHLES
jgi:NADH:ubiquinone oxidoreductase subunit F (NADH-binding)